MGLIFFFFILGYRSNVKVQVLQNFKNSSSIQDDSNIQIRMNKTVQNNFIARWSVKIKGKVVFFFWKIPDKAGKHFVRPKYCILITSIDLNEYYFANIIGSNPLSTKNYKLMKIERILFVSFCPMIVMHFYAQNCHPIRLMLMPLKL